MNWKTIGNNISNFFTNNFFNIIIFFITIIIGVVVIKLLLNFSKRIMAKTKIEQITQHFIFVIIKFLLYLVLVLILLSEIGVELTGVLTAISALLLAVGMALQNNISNVANGIIIVSTKMFNKGDYIIINDVEGSIEEINFLFTTLKTFDNKKITLPNSVIVNSEVINLDANNLRRVDFTFSVSYENDVELIKKIVVDVMKSDGRVYLTPMPFCKLKYLTINSIDFFCNCWCDTADYWDVFYYVTENVYNEFKRNNVIFPFNKIEYKNKDNVKLPFNPSPLQNRKEKERVIKKDFDIETYSLTELFKEKKLKYNNKNKKKENN